MSKQQNVVAGVVGCLVLMVGGNSVLAVDFPDATNGISEVKATIELGEGGGPTIPPIDPGEVDPGVIDPEITNPNEDDWKGQNEYQIYLSINAITNVFGIEVANAMLISLIREYGQKNICVMSVNRPGSFFLILVIYYNIYGKTLLH